MRHDDADEADHRTDREVDAAGKDDESLADRRDDDERVVGQQIAQHMRRQEMFETDGADGDRRARTR